MDGESAKFRIKIGGLEIEYEGKGSFLQDELSKLVENLVEVYAEHKDAIPVDAPSDAVETNGSDGSSIHTDHSTNTIANHLDVSSGTDLAIAAAARLTFWSKQDKFSRRQIGEEMKSATTFYTRNMSSNLSSSLSTLVKARRLNLIGKDVYALSAPEKATLEGRLAQLL